MLACPSPTTPRAAPSGKESNLFSLDELLAADEATPVEAPAAQGSATMSETAAFAAKLAEADEALMLESAYRENAERDLEALRAGAPSAEAAPDLQPELNALTTQLSEAQSSLDARNARMAELERARRPPRPPASDELDGAPRRSPELDPRCARRRSRRSPLAPNARTPELSRARRAHRAARRGAVVARRPERKDRRARGSSPPAPTSSPSSTSSPPSSRAHALRLSARRRLAPRPRARSPPSRQSSSSSGPSWPSSQRGRISSPTSTSSPRSSPPAQLELEPRGGVASTGRTS